MAPESGRDPDSVARRLVEGPRRFDFFQAVRLLERLLPNRAEVGRASDPEDELVRFHSDVSLSFPRGDISSVELPPPASDGDKQPPAQMVVNFMGVATQASFGSLPQAYANAILEQAREGHNALRDFLDLFNHRFISLFYQAWKKSRMAVLHESRQRSNFEQALIGLIGLGTRGLAGRLPMDDLALLARSGLLAMAPAPAMAIEALIESYFGAPAKTEPFIPSWYAVDENERTRLGAAHSHLGEDLFLGEQVRLVQTKFRIRVGPLRRALYEELLPQRPGFPALCRLVRLAAGSDLDFEVQLVLDRRDVQPLRLENSPELPSRLGCSAWLSEGEFVRDADDALFPSGSQLMGTEPRELDRKAA